ncbi:protein FAM151B-like [Contarinia nasturtii]|uniref:protein FAM151B-like n=1 Tax=Contarinia nasturtii TaxID=265458 RepID=UPI0012D40D74|nr:protein FAM151B-like [Contarinia nasturtii]
MDTINKRANMLTIFVLTFIMPTNLIDAASDYSNGGSTNLAIITWAHAVNSQALLEQVLANAKVQMIEADVSPGILKKSCAQETENPTLDTSIIKTIWFQIQSALNVQYRDVVMAHPPDTSSDLSLEDFLSKVYDHNSKSNKKKGIKLDIKDIDPLKRALSLIKQKNFADANTFINADVICGPGMNEFLPDKPIDAKEFLDAFEDFDGLSNVTLSIGWKTGSSQMQTAVYTQYHVDQMIKAINDNNVDKSHPISFPVRAIYAVRSIPTLKYLFDSVSKVYKVTFTIWTGSNDTFSILELQKLINFFGLPYVYVDIPDEMKSKLNLKSG